MRQNKYDEDAFFEKYSDMPRSRLGLAGAGEWPALERLLPGFAGKRVLDLGCGFGWHCRYAAQQGAERVLGIDLSENMLARARRETLQPNVEYRRMAMEDIDFPPGSFEVVLSSLALHYVADFAAVCERVAACLVPGGAFVFSVEHPVFTAQGRQDWFYGPGGEKLHWPVDRYFEEGLREAVFLGEAVTKAHRPLAAYVAGLLESGFTLAGLAEPTPTAEMLAAEPAMAEELRRPMMLILSARRG